MARAPTGSVSLILHWWKTFFYVWFIKTAQKTLLFTGNTRKMHIIVLIFMYLSHQSNHWRNWFTVTEIWSCTWYKIFKALILEERPIAMTIIFIFVCKSDNWLFVWFIDGQHKESPCIMMIWFVNVITTHLQRSCNKNQWDALFLKFILIKYRTCFRQIYCPSSGVSTLYTQQ